MSRRPGSGAVPRSGRWLLALAAVAVAFAAADTYVVVLALPDMMSSAGLSADELQRAAPIVSGFLLGYVAVLPLVGRFLQGVGGGGLVPATLALVADLYPAGRRGVPLGAVGAVQELGSVLGPLLGAL